MPLNLEDIMKKAKAKGIGISTNNSQQTQSLRPWQQESVLFPSNNLPTNQAKTEHKVDTNRTQTKHKPNTKWTQSGHKPHEGKTQTKHKVDTQPDTKKDTNRTQTEHKVDTKTGFSTLVGLQRKIMLFLYENCKKTRSKITEQLTLEHLADHLNVPIGSLKTSIRRLQIKSFIVRLDFKNGRSGWSKYEVPNNVFSELMQHETEHKLNTNRTQTEHKLNTKLNTEPDTSFFSGSGNYINTTTTEGSPFLNKTNQFSAEWLDIDIEPLNFIGFTKTHLSQIALQKKLSIQITQDSIYAFAFDLQENKKKESIKGDPINYFMGILRNGKPYTPPSNYESPQDKAMRLYAERLREIEQRRVAIEKEAITLAFNEWFTQLTDDQKRQLLPETMRRNAKIEKNKILENTAKGFFEREIWPEKKKKI